MTEPRLDSAHWAALDAAFDHLAELPESAWPAAIETLTAAMPAAAAAHLRSLLQRLAAQPDLLDAPAVSRLAPEREVAPGTRLGRWTVQGRLGSGGQSLVLAVHRSEGGFEQQAVMKLPRGSGFEREAARRLLRERQVLARLKHPGLPAVYDGGVLDDGSPLLVIERIEGEPIDRHCERAGLGLRGRVRLLAEVAAILAHAHAQLVLHRDVKPGNVLVESASGRVVLLDFGVAQSLDEEASRTAAGYTLSYAAPEQVRGERGTVATDLYGLGALALKLCCGRAPFEGLETSAQVQAVLAGDPPLPATLDPDLTAILSTCLRPLPDQRYASAEALRQDLLAWLDGRPVRARRGGRRYVLGKFLRRHRLAVGASTAAVLMLAGTTGVALQQAAESERARRQAEVSQRRAEQTVGLLSDLFVSAASGNLSGSWQARALVAEDMPPGTRLGLREIIDLASEQRLPQLDPAIRVPLHAAFGEVYAGLTDPDAAMAQFRAGLALQPDNPRLLAGLLKQQLQRAQPPAQAWSDLARLMAAPGDVPRAELVAVIERAANTRRVAGELQAAEALLAEALALYAGDAPVEALTEADQLARAHLDVQQARLALALGEQAAASAHLQGADAILLRVQGSQGKHRIRLLETRAEQQRLLGEFALAEQALQESLDLLALHLPDNLRLQARTLREIGITRRAAGDLAGSREAFESAVALSLQSGLPPQHNNLLSLRTSLAGLRMHEGAYAEALSEYRVLIADTPETFRVALLPELQLGVARARLALGEPSAAREDFARLLSGDGLRDSIARSARLGRVFSALALGEAVEAQAGLDALGAKSPDDPALALARLWLAQLGEGSARERDIASLREGMARPEGIDPVWLHVAPLATLCRECAGTAASSISRAQPESAATDTEASP